MRLAAIFLKLIPVLLLAGIISCKQTAKEYPPLDDFETKIREFDSLELELYAFYYSSISKNERQQIFATLSDTTRPISEAITLVENCKNLPKVFRNSTHATLLEVATCSHPEKILQKEDSSRLDSLSRLLTHYAIGKIIIHLDEVYDNKIIYDCRLSATLDSRCVFLDNNEMHQVSAFLGASYEVYPWFQLQDKIFLKFPSDSSYMELIDDGKYLIGSAPSRSYHFEHLRRPKQKKP